MPFSLTLNKKDSAGKSIRKNKKVTEEMCEKVWTEFLECVKNGKFEFSYASRKIEQDCGMSKGSAFIYLNIVKNLCSGQINTRNMKIEDLKFFANKIKDDLDERAVENAVNSLKQSIAYWREKIIGDYADKAQTVLNELQG